MTMKFTRNTIVWVLILAYLIVVSGFMSEKQSGQLINSIDITHPGCRPVAFY